MSAIQRSAKRSAIVSSERLAILCKVGSTDTQDLARELLAARSRIAELEAVVMRSLAAEGQALEIAVDMQWDAWGAAIDTALAKEQP